MNLNPKIQITASINLIVVLGLLFRVDFAIASLRPVSSEGIFPLAANSPLVNVPLVCSVSNVMAMLPHNNASINNQPIAEADRKFRRERK